LSAGAVSPSISNGGKFENCNFLILPNDPSAKYFAISPLTMQKAEKEQIIQLINSWRERSKLSLKQILARIQAEGCDVTRDMFENRFVRFDQKPDIAPELTMAVIAAFTKGLTLNERCMPVEAIELAKLTHMPINQIEAICQFFPESEFDKAFSLTASPKYKPAPTGPSRVHFPSKSYHRLIGRTQELQQLLTALRERKRKAVIAIVGLGGIGKTALAQEAMDQCWCEGIFQYIVWASAKTERFIGKGTRKIEVSDYSFEQWLDDIARQCKRDDFVPLSLEQKRLAVKQLLLEQRVLVVMDNLETIPDYEAFVDQLFQLLGQSKLLITSRHQLRLEYVFTLDLGGVDRHEGITFLREEGKERGIATMAQAKPDDLSAIHQVTGGAPLAMKLVVGQLSRLPLDNVLYNLQTASFAGPNYDFYRFIFKYSWDMLDLESRKTLVSMSVFDLANGSSAQSLSEISQIEVEVIQMALEQLILLSLVDINGNLQQHRYTLHPLTHYFILSDIVKKWS